MSDPFIHILIRASKGRKELFERCFASVKNQSYLPCNIYVSYDDDSCMEWIPNYIFSMKVSANNSLGTFFYNDYCNLLMAELNPKPGHWFMFLDCDDYLANDNVLEEISEDLDDDRYDAIVCQMSRDTGKVKPSNDMIAHRMIETGRIGLPCLIVRSQHKGLAKVGVKENSDFEWIKAIVNRVPTKFVKKVVVHSPMRSFGK